jgi:uncharacterized protein (TIGR03067 family)
MPRLLLVAAALALGFAPAPFTGARRTDLERLQGVWVGEMGALEARIEGDTLSYFRGGKLVRVYALKLDTASSPKGYDIEEVVKGAGAGILFHFRGIYKLDGDMLTMCSAPSGRPRPAAFAVTGPGSELKVLTRKR